RVDADRWRRRPSRRGCGGRGREGGDRRRPRARSRSTPRRPRTTPRSRRRVARRVAPNVADDCEGVMSAPGVAARIADETFAAEVSRALDDIKARLGRGSSKNRGPLFALDAVDLLQREFPKRRWLVTGLITRGGITIIGAEPKAAKTWLGTELAVAI